MKVWASKKKQKERNEERRNEENRRRWRRIWARNLGRLVCRNRFKKENESEQLGLLLAAPGTAIVSN
ncbi:hypothetical protein L3Y34_004963 [Caenorhabditis briggsae]|uniref:Uncharacterized protein n=1 Tax=Caenorhabditis briggsae TaxID=6238 RepID=A0AAE9D6J5_CAEBR|nr:hypothetical protein L3Y34_004963 [Caenorhabditis briggsae]